MFSSKVKDAQQNTEDVAEDIANKTQVIVSGAADDAKEAIGKMGDYAQQEGTAIKAEIEALLGKIYDLLKSEDSREIRQKVLETANHLGKCVAAWTGNRKAEIASAVRSGSQQTRDVIQGNLMLSLLIAAGTGAFVAYWLTHRSSLSDRSVAHR